MCILYIHSALDKALKRNKKVIDITPQTKIVIFSDLHRGIGDWADDFMHNALIFHTALKYYFLNDFIYIELGDGDELYENRRLSAIVRRYADIYRIMDDFHREDRLILVWGNHNMQMRKKRWFLKELQKAQTYVPGLFREITVHESLKLGEKIFLVHGHQGDLISDCLAPFGRLWVRFLWRWVQNRFGVNDPTSAAQNALKRNKVEEKIFTWAKRNNLAVIAGHTHRPVFESLNKQQRLRGMKKLPFYFNCGSGIHPRCVPCLEIENMEIRLVKWYIIADPEDENRLKVKREPIAPCQKDLKKLVKEML